MTRGTESLRDQEGLTTPPEELSWKQKIAALLSSDPVVNSVVAAAITAGFFHGWLKIRFPSPATTFLFDALLSLALVLAYLKQKRRTTFIPRGPIGAALKSFYLLCFLYLLLPWGPPIIISVAAVRGWCFATLMFSLGYQLTQDIHQVKGYFYFLIILGLITAGYGLRQSPAEIERLMDENEYFAERYQNTYYVTSKGRELRVFSTFVSSGAFGGTMAYVAIFAIALLSDPGVSKKERWLLILAIIPIAYAMVRSGSRSALISLFFGFVIIAWHRRNLVNWVIVPSCIVLVIKVAVSATGGSALERYSSLLNFDEVYYRNSIPTSIGWNYMMDGHLLGGGLGKSTYSVPSFLSARVAYRDYKPSDGDLGRLMIETGVPGLIFFGWVLFVAVRSVLGWLHRFQNTPVSTVALACAGCVVMALASFPSGSPFLGIPMGAMVWFFVGTMQKLFEQHERGALGEPTPAPLQARRSGRGLHPRAARPTLTRVRHHRSP